MWSDFETTVSTTRMGDNSDKNKSSRREESSCNNKSSFEVGGGIGKDKADCRFKHSNEQTVKNNPEYDKQVAEDKKSEIHRKYIKFGAATGGVSGGGVGGGIGLASGAGIGVAIGAAAGTPILGIGNLVGALVGGAIGAVAGFAAGGGAGTGIGAGIAEFLFHKKHKRRF